MKGATPMKKFVSLALCFVLLIGCLGVFATADDGVAIRVYKINPETYDEGCICIFTPERGEVLGAPSQNFAYWAVVVFEEDEATGGYKCTATYPLDSSDKTNVAIPANGFILAGNTGNDWPSLFATATGNEWFYSSSNSQGIPYSECPNYATDRVKEDLALIANIQVGDVMYLNGIDLASSMLNTNEDEETIFYYSDEFECNAFVTTVKPDISVVDPSEEPSKEESSEEPSKEEPSEEPSKEEPSDPIAPVTGDLVNVALGKAYTTDALFRQGGREDNWGWSENAEIAYPDEDGITLTDGIHAAEDALYSDPAWIGFNTSTPSTTENGYAWMIVDLGKAENIEKLVLYLGGKGLTSGLSLSEKVEFFVSNDNENWTSVGEAVIPEDDDTVHEAAAVLELDKAVSAKYIQARVSREKGWMFVSEFEAYAAQSGSEAPSTSEKPTEPTSDNGIVALALISVLAIAGAVIVKKSR